MRELLPEMGINTTFVDIADLNSVEAAITDKTRAVFTETIGNPTLKAADISRLAELAHSKGAVLIVDNTFCPMMISPAALGADIVVYSMTKFINGASDLIAGVICGKADFINRLMDLHTGRVMLLGPTMDARIAFDIIQRLPHLPMRMREHSRRAMAMAKRLLEMGVDVVVFALMRSTGGLRDSAGQTQRPAPTVHANIGICCFVLKPAVHSDLYAL
jgi:methionine-gamma-lyase